MVKCFLRVIWTNEFSIICFFTPVDETEPITTEIPIRSRHTTETSVTYIDITMLRGYIDHSRYAFVMRGKFLILRQFFEIFWS